MKVTLATFPFLAILTFIPICNGFQCYVCSHSLDAGGPDSVRCSPGGASEYLKHCNPGYEKCLYRITKNNIQYLHQHFRKTKVDRECALTSSEVGCKHETIGEPFPFGQNITTCICADEACNSQGAGGTSTVFFPQG